MRNDGTAKRPAKLLVDLVGFEPTTSSMPWRCGPTHYRRLIKNKALSPARCGANMAFRAGSGTIAELARGGGVTYATGREFRAAVKDALEREEFALAARLIELNKEWTSDYWRKWAAKVRSGEIYPAIPRIDPWPPLKDGDLFGEPLTNGRLRGR